VQLAMGGVAQCSWLENDEWQSGTQFSESEMQMPWDLQSMSSRTWPDPYGLAS